jgi:predicted O-linked N-acetylglucosamine transferase (SPINDLY family)
MNAARSVDAADLTPELCLLLACARIGSENEKRAAIESVLAAGIDWTLFAQIVVAQGFTGFAADTLARLATDSVPEDILGAFHAVVDEISRGNRALFDELGRVFDALRKAGVEAIPFKGPVLAIRAYGDLRLRQFGDLDFLVRDEDLDSAITALAGIGYKRTGNLTASQFALIHRLQGQEIIYGESNGIAVEPHTRLISSKMALDIDYDGLWRRARSISINGRTFLTLAPEDDLLLLAIHGGKEMWWRLKWVCDVAAFIGSHPELDWAAVAVRARAQGCLRMLLLAGSLARRCFNAPIPPAITALELRDRVIGPMVHRIVGRWQADEPGASPDNKSVSLERLQLHDGIVRQARYMARTLLLPSPRHVISAPLPPNLDFAYIPIKLSHDFLALPIWKALRQALAPLERLPHAFAGSELALAVMPVSADTKLTVRRYRQARKDAKRALSRVPDDPVAWRDLGDALAGLRRHKDAIACYDKALAYAPQDTTIWKRRVAALQATGSSAGVLDPPSNPQDAKTWAIHAGRLFSSRRYAHAIEASDRALAIDPDSVASVRVGIHARLWACDWTRRAADERRVTDEIAAGRPIVTTFYHRAISDSESERFRLAQLWTRGRKPAAARLWNGERYVHEKIRIAYCSAGFGDHGVAGMLVGCLEHRDRSCFHTTGISLRPTDRSDTRQRAAAAFDRYIDVESINGFEVAKLLHELETDIIVHLDGTSGDSPTRILSYRPAPLQVNYLGSPGTTGLPFFDYIIADHMVIPDPNRAYYSEQVVYLPHCCIPSDRTRETAARAPSRADAGLPATGFVFAFHDAEYKIGPETFDIWMRLLRTIDGSVLWLKNPNPAAKLNLRREASTRGVNPDRLLFAPRLAPGKEYFARLELADLFLDTRPHNAETAAGDALWAGVPIVTCPGDTFPGRMVASILHAAGLPEMIAASLEEYENLAAALARDPERLARIKAKLNRNRDREPLFDTARFIRDLEIAYAAMWRRQQDGLPPACLFAEGEPAHSR